MKVNQTSKITTLFNTLKSKRTKTCILESMNWNKYLALLHWQTPTISIEDFQRLKSRYSKIQHPNDIFPCFSHETTKQFVLKNPYWWKEAELTEKICQKENIQLTWWGETHYPPHLKYYPDSPVILSYKGSPVWMKDFPLAVVGSRKMQITTSQWMDYHLSSFLKKYSVCLLSGGALGVDQKAHSLALRTQNSTICFLPCGLLHLYPPKLKEWVQPLLQNKGVLISPFPPHYTIRKHFFYYRNSIIVRMSRIVLILQAEERSGSMLTAHLASRLGVTLATLPGPVMNNFFKGNLKLLSDGILMVRDQLDLEVLYQAHFKKNTL